MVQKSIIIDFDHTIGYFEQIIFIINIIEVTYRVKLKKEQLHILFKCFPFIFRPKLFDILKLVLYLQKDEKIVFFILYTRNTQPHFVEAVVSFMESTLNFHPLFQFKLFEKTKIKRIETIHDEIKNNIHSHVLCFIDNTFFPCYNQNKETKYIKCETYIYDYKVKDILALFPYYMFKGINENILHDYIRHKKRNKSRKKGLPYQLYELNSVFVYQSISDFVS
tara:strand:- start:499 stop:1164 length:666 start_codon:yes stop_codon:yes gene_type:complete